MFWVLVEILYRNGWYFAGSINGVGYRLDHAHTRFSNDQYSSIRIKICGRDVWSDLTWMLRSMSMICVADVELASVL